MEGGLDFGVGEPDEVFEADMEHLGAVDGLDVEEDVGLVHVAGERGADVGEESGVDQTLGCGAEVVSFEPGARMYSGGGFKLGLGVGTGVIEDDLCGGVG